MIDQLKQMLTPQDHKFQCAAHPDTNVITVKAEHGVWQELVTYVTGHVQKGLNPTQSVLWLVETDVEAPRIKELCPRAMVMRAPISYIAQCSGDVVICCHNGTSASATGLRLALPCAISRFGAIIIIALGEQAHQDVENVLRQLNNHTTASTAPPAPLARTASD